MNAITKIETNDYTKDYGGVYAMINGVKASFGSVKGYCLYNKDDVQEGIDRAVRLGHDLVWVSLCSTVITSSKGYYEREVAKWANVPKLSVGDVVEFEGNTYKIATAPNGNFKLVSVK